MSKLSRAQIEELKDCFNFFDADRSGELAMKELKQIARHLGRAMTEEELQKVMDVVSKRKDASAILFDDFIKYMNKIGYQPATMPQIESIFKMMDRDNSGYLTFNEIYDAIRRVKPNFPKQKIEELMSRIDADKNQKITFDEFIEIFN